MQYSHSSRALVSGFGLLAVLGMAACMNDPAAPGSGAASPAATVTTASTPTVVVVHPGDLGSSATPDGWFFYNDETDGVDNSLGSIVTGPDTPPDGEGSVQISVTGTQRRNVATYQFSGTPLADITELGFSTYNPSAGNGGSANRSGYLNFNVDFDGSDTWQKRLVFLPSDNGTIQQNTWQQWDAIQGGSALWRYSGATWPGTSTSGSTARTWSEILTSYPDVRIRVNDAWLGVRVGEPYADGYTENIDGFVFGTASGTTVYDFEPDGEAPLVLDVTAEPVAINQTGTVTATIDDSGTGSSNIESASFTFDGGSAASMDASDGDFDSPTEEVTGSFSAPSEPGLYDVCVSGTDEAENTGGPECVSVAVYDPSGGFVTGGGWIDSPAGAYMPSDATVVTSDDLGGSWLLTTRTGSSGAFVGGPGVAPLGDGSFEMTLSDGSGKATLFNYAYPGELLSDISDLTYATYRSSSSTNPAAQYPGLNIEVDYVGDGASYTTLVWEPIYAYGPAQLATDEWQTWDAMAPSQTSFGGGWWSTHAIPGVCAFSCYVSWQTIVENNPNAKIVGGFGVNIGSGWNGEFTGAVDALSITTGEGTTTYDFEPEAGFNPTGKATFGFVSKYKKGATVPDGNTEFQFKDGGLSFHSTSYDWLIVTGSDYAKFKGDGTVDGMPGTYKFQLWAGDGTGSNGDDTFRIKIWNDDGVLYDNGMDQEIGGGNIIVHSGKGH